MRSLTLALLLLLAAGVLAGCQTDGITKAAKTTFQPAHVNEPVPAPVGPAGIEARPADRERKRSGACAPPATCRPVNPRTSPIGEVYAGAAAVAFPAWGGAVEFGQVFSRTRLATWSLEGDATWQDLSNQVTGTGVSGDFAQVRGSFKASFNPCGRGHPTARAGIGWFRTTEETDFVNNPGDYFAFHFGVGYEFDVTRQLTTGPEISAIIAAEEKGFDLEVAPQVRWHVIWKF